jgi:hypothetical protein
MFAMNDCLASAVLGVVRKQLFAQGRMIATLVRPVLPLFLSIDKVHARAMLVRDFLDHRQTQSGARALVVT